MKTPPNPSRINEALFKLDSQEQPVRLIKASQAGKMLSGGQGQGAHDHGDSHKKPEIRLIQSGADYCDLEVVCGCGESTKVRCWNAPAAGDKAAA
jgi:hypothetical protein